MGDRVRGTLQPGLFRSCLHQVLLERHCGSWTLKFVCYSLQVSHAVWPRKRMHSCRKGICQLPRQCTRTKPTRPRSCSGQSLYWHFKVRASDPFVGTALAMLIFDAGPLPGELALFDETFLYLYLHASQPRAEEFSNVPFLSSHEHVEDALLSGSFRLFLFLLQLRSGQSILLAPCLSSADSCLGCTSQSIARLFGEISV
mmetsp:Transcript_36388/g.67757  ORF Transcript_36388/g.67757 Transcript_36388/m.67757 type:complete len:200 (+) Transcript_36388:333-932(+)